MTGMAGHESPRMQKDEWLTPPWIIEALGPFDLDPCAPINPPWDIARETYDIRHDGLSRHWHGRVWCNPPYGRETGKWLARLAAHNNGIALIFARTETKMFINHVWNRADGLLFLHGRLTFHNVDGTPGAGSAGAPSVLVAYGLNNVDALRRLTDRGTLVSGWRS